MVGVHPIEEALDPPPRHAYMLNDLQIRQAQKSLGIIGGAYREAAARYASYELHASDVIQELSLRDGNTAYRDVEPEGGEIVIGSMTTVKIYTQESLNLPRYVYADVVALGQLFAAGLTAGSTYVDPGSTGSIYIAVTNLNACAVRIPVGSPLARAQFFVLGDPALTPHGGPETRRPVRFKVDPAAGRPTDPQVESVAQSLEGLRQEFTQQVTELRGVVDANRSLVIDASPGDSSAYLIARCDDLWDRLVRVKVALYLLGLLLALSWMQFGGEATDKVFSRLAGDHLSPVLKFLIPPLAFALLLALSRDARVTLGHLWSQMRARVGSAIRGVLEDATQR